MICVLQTQASSYELFTQSSSVRVDYLLNEGVWLRFFRAFLVLLEERLKLRSFIVFTVLAALVGPVFVVLNSVTNLESRESRPLLSEKASVNHFNIQGYGRALPGSEGAILLFRESPTERAPEFPISPAFITNGRLNASSTLFTSPPWSTSSRGNIADFYQVLFPLLMVVMGIVALPSRRKLALLHIALPWGRWGCFILTAGVLVFQVSLLVVASGSTTGLSLIATQGGTLASAGFVATYFTAILVYGLGFALLGFVLSEFIRNRPIALLVGLVLIIGIWVFVSPLPARGYASLIKSITGSLPYQSQDFAIKLAWQLLQSPFYAVTNVARSAETLAAKVDDPYRSRADLHRALGLSFIGLGLFACFWLIVGWIGFPRTARRL
ncbi:hypothetical protein KKG90_11800 [Candidatus Bipolaricaulota bacterium]|nr:hypothetical protein [Candidatus Bipolaricaulota bacterium]